jgi:hypothetical protein
MSIKPAEDLGGVIVRTKLNLSQILHKRERSAPPPCNQHPGSAISPLGKPQGLQAPIIALTLGNIRDFPDLCLKNDGILNATYSNIWQLQFWFKAWGSRAISYESRKTWLL